MPERPSALSQLIVLLGLRLRLGSRLFFGSKLRVIALIVAVLLFVPLSIFFGIMVALWAAAGVPNVAHYLFLSVYVYVLLTNLFGIIGNEFFDTSKVFLYPVSPSLVFVASVVGNLFTPVFLFFLPSLFGLVIGMGGTPEQALARICLLVLFWLLTVASSQVVALISANFLNTRRFQDLVRVVAPLSGLFLYVGIQFLVRGGESAESIASWTAHFPRPLRLLPSYWVSTLFSDFGGGRFPVIFGGLGLSVYGIASLFLFGGWLQNRAFFGEMAATGPRGTSTDEEKSLPRGQPSILSHLIPDPVLAMARKEFLIYRREPGFKTILIQQMAIVLLVIVMQLLGPARQDDAFMVGPSALIFVVSFLLYIESTLLLNQFGPEGQGVEYLLLHPTDRRTILFGKNLAAVVLFGGMNAILIFLLGFFLGAGSDLLFACVVQLGALVVIVGFGNWTSVVLAWPMFARGRSPMAQMRAERLGCLRPFVSLVCLGLLAILMAPLILLTFWGRGAMGPVFLLPLTGITFGYCLLLYMLFLQLGASVLGSREERLIALFTRSPD